MLLRLNSPKIKCNIKKETKGKNFHKKNVFLCYTETFQFLSKHKNTDKEKNYEWEQKKGSLSYQKSIFSYFFLYRNINFFILFHFFSVEK